MKTQRRHELETNEILNWINHHKEQYQSHLRTIGIVVIGGVAIIAATLILRSAQRSREDVAWRTFYNALSESSPEAMLEVANTNADSPVALWAKQTAAERQMNQGLRALFTDREEAERALKDAEKNLKEIESKAASNRALADRVRLDLAQTYEALNELENARKYYELVAQSGPATAIGKMASQRAELLAKADTQQWYEWFSRQTPKPRPPSSTGLGGPGGPSPLLPGSIDSLKDLPETPDLPSLEKQFPPVTKPTEKDAPEKADAPEKTDAPEKADAPEKTDAPEKADAPEKKDPPEKSDASEEAQANEQDQPSK